MSKKTKPEKEDPTVRILQGIEDRMDEFEEESLEILGEYLDREKLRSVDADRIVDSIRDFDNPAQWKTLDLIYYGEPKPQARARYSSQQNFFYDPSKGLKKWMVEQLSGQLPKGFALIESELEVEMTFYRLPVKSASKSDLVLMELGLIRPDKTPDIDNYQKLIQDALNKTLYKDDSSIVQVYTEKRYSMRPRVKLRLRYRTRKPWEGV